MAITLDSRSLTAEEYGRLPNDGKPTELVRGRVVAMNRPYTMRGYHVYRAAMVLGQFVDQHSLGWIVVGDAGVVTHRNPDSVRGPDVAFYSYGRIPRGPLPKGYWPASPELGIEIRSEDDRWKDILQKVGEYLGADVLTVAVVDPAKQRVHLYSADNETMILNATDMLRFPDILPGFEVVVAKLFE